MDNGSIGHCVGCPNPHSPVCRRDRSTNFSRRTPDIVFVGSSPRGREIKQGMAFSGEGPRVLRGILSHRNVDISRCWFTLAVRCRLHGGRKARVEEIRSCAPRLHDSLRAAKPRAIVAMGDDAVHSLIDSPRSVATIRGHVHQFEGIPVMPTVDPHRVVRINPRYAAPEEKHDPIGSPDSFPNLQHDVDRVIDYVYHSCPLLNPIPYEDYRIIRNTRDLYEVLDQLLTLPLGQLIAVDVETSSLDYHTGHILTLGLSWREGSGVGIDWSLLAATPQAREELDAALARLRPIFHNGAFDVPWLRAAGVNVHWGGDTMLLHYLLDERQNVHGLERLAIDYLSWPNYETTLRETYKVGSAAASDAEASYANVDREALLRYNVADCDATLRIWNRLQPSADAERLMPLHDDLLIPAAEHFCRLEDEGMLVDQEYLETVGQAWRDEMQTLEQEMRSTPGAESINLNSTKQVAAFLYDHLELRPMPTPRDDEYVDPDLVLTLTDGVEDPEAQEYFRVAASTAFMKLKPRSTSTYMLWWLADQHPWPKLLVRYRVLGTRHKTYYRGIRDRLSDGRIRPRFRLHGTRTGRLSSTNPNIHGIARNQTIKNIFVADPSYTLVAADYSQAEVRMMAHFAEDHELMQALQESDIHRAISRRLFSVTEEELQRMDHYRVQFLRRAAKTIIFGLIYGRTPKSLAPQLGVSLEETKEYIGTLFQMMPKVREFIRQQQDRVLREQEAISLFGRRRRFPLILRANASQIRRQGVNHPIQSSVSDMTLMANLKILQHLRDKEIAVRVWPHIHDGFIFQVEDGHRDYAVDVTRTVMSTPPFATDVHFAIEIDVGKRWGELETVFAG